MPYPDGYDPMDEDVPVSGSEPQSGHAAKHREIAEKMNIVANAAGSAAGGGLPPFAIRYLFSTTTTDSDPGDGFLRFNNATQPSTTVIRADNLDVAAEDWSAALVTMDDSTNTIKGHIQITHVSDPAKWILFTNSAVASPSGYKNITVTVVDSGSAAFEDGDEIIMSFVRAGNVGTSATQMGWAYEFYEGETNLANTGVAALVFNNASEVSVTHIGVGNGTTNGAGDPNVVYGWLESFTSTPVGYMTLQSRTTLSRWNSWLITEVNAAGAYYDFTVEHVDHQNSFTSADGFIYLTLYPNLSAL